MITGDRRGKNCERSKRQEEVMPTQGVTWRFLQLPLVCRLCWGQCLQAREDEASRHWWAQLALERQWWDLGWEGGGQGWAFCFLSVGFFSVPPMASLWHAVHARHHRHL